MPLNLCKMSQVSHTVLLAVESKGTTRKYKSFFFALNAPDEVLLTVPPISHL